MSPTWRSRRNLSWPQRTRRREIRRRGVTRRTGERDPRCPIEAARPRGHVPATEGRWGSREVEITDVLLTSDDGERAMCFNRAAGWTSDSPRAPIAINDFVIGIGIFNAGVCCYGTSRPEDLRADLRGCRRRSSSTAWIWSRNPQAGCRRPQADGYPYDYHRLLYTFRVKSRTKDVGVYRPRHQWRFSDGVSFARVGD